MAKVKVPANTVAVVIKYTDEERVFAEYNAGEDIDESDLAGAIKLERGESTIVYSGFRGRFRKFEVKNEAGHAVVHVVKEE